MNDYHSHTTILIFELCGDGVIADDNARSLGNGNENSKQTH